MTNLKKPVKRVSRGLVREAGKLREVVVILRPPNVIGFRAKGCRKEYQLTAEACYLMAVTAEACYTMAVRAHVAEAKKRKAKKKPRK